MGTKNWHVTHIHQVLMVAPWEMQLLQIPNGRKSSSCHWKEELGIEKKTEGADEEKIGSEGKMGLAHQKRLPTILKPYVSGAVLVGLVE